MDGDGFLIKGNARARPANGRRPTRNAVELTRQVHRAPDAQSGPGAMNLPALRAEFSWLHESWGAALRCGPLSTIAQHGFTTRQLKLRGGPAVRPAEWASAVALSGAPLDRLARVKQVHGRAVRVLERGQVSGADLAHVPEADAIVSNEPGLALAVQVADCVPILLADRRGGIVAAVHAGWRGTAAGIVNEAVSAMVRLGAEPSTLVAALGPSIGPCCYEVGGELVEAFLAAGHSRRDVDRWFSRVEGDGQRGGALRLDVAHSNVDQLVEAGLPREQIHVCGLCTQSYRTVFDSYRADGSEAGRMVAVIRVPSVRV